MCNHKWMTFGADEKGNFRVCSRCGKKVYTITNADRIRAMSDEELAKYLSNPCNCEVDPERDGFRECGNDLCVKYLLEWLQQPAEEETP